MTRLITATGLLAIICSSACSLLHEREDPHMLDAGMMPDADIIAPLDAALDAPPEQDAGLCAPSGNIVLHIDDATRDNPNCTALFTSRGALSNIYSFNNVNAPYMGTLLRMDVRDTIDSSQPLQCEVLIEGVTVNDLFSPTLGQHATGGAAEPIDPDRDAVVPPQAFYFSVSEDERRLTMWHENVDACIGYPSCIGLRLAVGSTIASSTFGEPSGDRFLRQFNLERREADCTVVGDDNGWSNHSVRLLVDGAAGIETVGTARPGETIRGTGIWDYAFTNLGSESHDYNVPQVPIELTNFIVFMY